MLEGWGKSGPISAKNRLKSRFWPGNGARSGLAQIFLGQEIFAKIWRKFDPKFPEIFRKFSRPTKKKISKKSKNLTDHLPVKMTYFDGKIAKLADLSANFDPILAPPGTKIQTYPRFPENPKDFLSPGIFVRKFLESENFRRKFSEIQKIFARKFSEKFSPKAKITPNLGPTGPKLALGRD